jgi:dienelactone hydrolase
MPCTNHLKSIFPDPLQSKGETMLTFGDHIDGYHDVQNQMADYLRRMGESFLRRQTAEKAALNQNDFEARRKQVHAAFLHAIGELPTERTRLNARCTGRLDQDGYTIEKIIYESQPDFPVTSALYLPKDLRAPAPAVLFVHGHSDAGKSYPEYQAVCIDLARNGFVVLAMDPPGQGERKQTYDLERKVVRIPSCTSEHTYVGMQQVICGASLARHFIWDAMRGVDYLQTRPEVDPDRIGVTGNSGGGTQTSYLMMAEPRLKVAVPCTFITTLESYMKSGQPQDMEQIVWGCFCDGPDHDDYITAMAPKPVLVGPVAWDFFPIEGTIEAVQRARHVYAGYGAEEKVETVVAPSRHAYAPMLRQAAVNWFKVHLKNEKPDFETGPVETLPEDALWCTPGGQVHAAFPQSRTLFDLNREWLAAHLPASTTSTGAPEQAEQIRQALVDVLAVDMSHRAAPIFTRIIWEGEAWGYRAEKLFFFSEPDIAVTGVMLHPQGEAVQTDIVLFANGTNEIGRHQSRLEALLARNHRVLVYDVRGVGGVKSRSINRDQPPHDSEYKMACDAMMMKRSTLGMRVFDVLRAYDYLRTRPDVERIGIIGVDDGAFWAYYAAALEEGIDEGTFENLLYSYRALAESDGYDQDRYNLRTMAWGILRRFDLIDLLPCLHPRPCTFSGLRHPNGTLLVDGEPFLTQARDRGYLLADWQPEVRS